MFSLSCAKLPCLLTETHFILVPADLIIMFSTGVGTDRMMDYRGNVF